MITGNETINKYTKYNKIYIPNEYYNQNYKYTINGNEITIITNNNCYTNYNTKYCDCYKYNEQYNIITESYSCNNNVGNYQLNFNNITNDINSSYRITKDFVNDYIIGFGIIIIVLLFTILFKRNSRNL